MLHGVWMRGLTLWPLARRLRRFGYRAEVFDYASLLHGPAPSVDKLATRLQALADGPVHLVGHSLGGLVALETVGSYAGLPPGRVLCLGSPLAGSSAARGLARHHLGFWLGRSGTLLRSGLHALPEGRDVGVIAGSKPMGLGRYFGDFDGLNDGTVAVWETRLPGLADHRVLPDSHTGLLLDPRVGDLAAGFLRDGRFPA
ncbi:MAG: alpha/beta fold hydrolase [Pseudomonadota bacterium]